MLNEICAKEGKRHYVTTEYDITSKDDAEGLLCEQKEGKILTEKTKENVMGMLNSYLPRASMEMQRA